MHILPVDNLKKPDRYPKRLFGIHRSYKNPMYIIRDLFQLHAQIRVGTIKVDIRISSGPRSDTQKVFVLEIVHRTLGKVRRFVESQ
jgi:hypothetical protein